jgi:hypothetical protein
VWGFKVLLPKGLGVNETRVHGHTIKRKPRVARRSQGPEQPGAAK